MNLVSHKKLKLRGIEVINDTNSSRKGKEDYKVKIEERANNQNNIVIISNKNKNKYNNNNTDIKVIKRTYKKETKEISLAKKIETIPPPIFGRYYYNKNAKL